MNKKRWTTILLIAIILFAAFLRLYKFASYPDGFNADEAALGYNAYSLLKTAHDEHGHFMPVTFESFGDFKAGLYVYILLPFVAVLGLTEWAVRLPSALFGVATVYLMYLLAKKIFDSDLIALSAAFFLAVSPWHLLYSRGGWEVNVATFFITLGVYAFLRALDRPKWFTVCLLSWLAAMYTYQSPKVIVPLLALGLFALYWKRLWALRRQLVLPIVVAAVCTLPLLTTFIGKAGTARFSGVSIFTDQGPITEINQARGEYANPNSLPAKVFHNKFIAYSFEYLKNYSDHFTPSFLFFDGDSIQRNNVPETGEMYVFDALLVIVGLLSIITIQKEHKKAVLWWLVVAPTASAITFQTPNALRSQNEVIPLVLLSALGFATIMRWAWTKKVWLKSAVVVLTLVIFAYCLGKYLHEYYVHIPTHNVLADDYGFDQVVPFVESIKGNYQKVIVTDTYDQPYILFLFFSKYDPAKFQPQSILSPESFGFETVRHYDKYEFRAITPNDVANDKNTLLVGTDKEIPGTDKRIVKTVTFPNGQPAFRIIGT